MASSRLVFPVVGVLIAAFTVAAPTGVAHSNTSCSSTTGFSILRCTFDCNAGATVWVSVSGGLPGSFGSAECLGAVAECTVQIGQTSCYDESDQESTGHWHNNDCNVLGAAFVSCGAF